MNDKAIDGDGNTRLATDDDADLPQQPKRNSELPPTPSRDSVKPVPIPPPQSLLRCTSSSERRRSFLHSVSRCTSSGGGRRTSITEAEIDILQSIANNEGETDQQDEVNASKKSSQMTTKDHFRASVTQKLPFLTTDEEGFLQKLADAGHEEHLERAAAVLEKDPLYQLPGDGPDERRTNVFSHAVRVLEKHPDKQVIAKSDQTAEQQHERKILRDASFRKELWDQYWSDSSSRRLEIARLSAVSSPQIDKASRHKQHEHDEKRQGLIYFFQHALLLDDSDEEETKDTVSGNDFAEDIPFWVLGTTIDDDSVQPMVLSPPMMDSLRPHLPYACQQDNFWLKYSMVRDGASLHALHHRARSSARTILAIETLDGDVFGSFTSSPWRVDGHAYYGSGESFLWRLAKSRYTSCRTIEEQQILESNIEVFGWSGKNRNVQLLPSLESNLAIGGGPPDDQDELDARHVAANTNLMHSGKDWGFGLALTNDLSQGTSQYSVTFDNPPLPTTGQHVFQVANMEVWTLSPVDDENQAELLELSRLFVFDHGNFIEA